MQYAIIRYVDLSLVLKELEGGDVIKQSQSLKVQGIHDR